jgi:hypothetical protein
MNASSAILQIQRVKFIRPAVAQHHDAIVRSQAKPSNAPYGTRHLEPDSDRSEFWTSIGYMDFVNVGINQYVQIPAVARPRWKAHITWFWHRRQRHFFPEGRLEAIQINLRRAIGQGRNVTSVRRPSRAKHVMGAGYGLGLLGLQVQNLDFARWSAFDPVKNRLASVQKRLAVRRPCRVCRLELSRHQQHGCARESLPDTSRT